VEASRVGDAGDISSIQRSWLEIERAKNDNPIK